MVKRISKRVANSVKAGLKSQTHHEAYLPLQPRYLIEITVNHIIDLAPPKAKGSKKVSCEAY